MVFLNELKYQLHLHRNLINSVPMAAYMKYKFPFLGIKSPERKLLLKNVINSNKIEVKNNVSHIAKSLYDEPEREFHYCAIEIYETYMKHQYKVNDIEDIVYLITVHSHWDSVDFIAKHVYGQFLKEHPTEIDSTIERFTNSKNMWLNRSAILFQLGYKASTDSDLLFELCDQHKTSEEFFIQKAIGWALREYAKVNPSAVLEFVKKTKLKSLSKREATRRLK